MVADLLDRNLDAELLVPEDDDIPLAERVRRINAHCLALGVIQCVNQKTQTDDNSHQHSFLNFFFLLQKLRLLNEHDADKKDDSKYHKYLI